jgi:hypothetical protein
MVFDKLAGGRGINPGSDGEAGHFGDGFPVGGDLRTIQRSQILRHGESVLWRIDPLRRRSGSFTRRRHCRRPALPGRTATERRGYKIIGKINS